MGYIVKIAGNTCLVEVDDQVDQVELKMDGKILQIDMEPLDGEHHYSLLIHGTSYVVAATEQDEGHEVVVNGISTFVEVEDEQMALLQSQAKATRALSGGQIKAPMPGRIVAVQASVGDSVEAGQGMIVIEAMKMENELRAQSAGTVREVRVQEGDTVEKNDVLIVIGD